MIAGANEISAAAVGLVYLCAVAPSLLCKARQGGATAAQRAPAPAQRSTCRPCHAPNSLPHPVLQRALLVPSGPIHHPHPCGGSAHGCQLHHRWATRQRSGAGGRLRGSGHRQASAAAHRQTRRVPRRLHACTFMHACPIPPSSLPPSCSGAVAEPRLAAAGRGVCVAAGRAGGGVLPGHDQLLQVPM